MALPVIVGIDGARGSRTSASARRISSSATITVGLRAGGLRRASARVTFEMTGVLSTSEGGGGASARAGRTTESSSARQVDARKPLGRSNMRWIPHRRLNVGLLVRESAVGKPVEARLALRDQEQPVDA